MHTTTGSTVAAKRDEKGAKLRLSLVNPEFIEEVAKVREFGVSKHGLDSYKLYPNKMYIDAILRHVSAYQQGEEFDKESGLHHLSHVSVSCMFIIEKDRWSVPQRLWYWIRRKLT